MTRIPRQTEIESGNEMAHPEGTFRLRYEQHGPFAYPAFDTVTAILWQIRESGVLSNYVRLSA